MRRMWFWCRCSGNRSTAGRAHQQPARQCSPNPAGRRPRPSLAHWPPAAPLATGLSGCSPTAYGVRIWTIDCVDEREHRPQLLALPHASSIVLLAFEACASLATRNACSGVLDRLGPNPGRRQAFSAPAIRLCSWVTPHELKRPRPSSCSAQPILVRSSEALGRPRRSRFWPAEGKPGL